jgi:hypothetical protein
MTPFALLSLSDRNYRRTVLSNVVANAAVDGVAAIV